MDGFVLVFVLPLLVVAIYIEYRFLRTLRDVLRAVSERNRVMQPESVWLNFIPLFNLVWMFVTVVKIRDSARAEFAFRGLRVKEDKGYGSGLAYAIASVLSQIYVPTERLTNDAAIVILAIFSWIVSLTCFISWLVFWAQSSQLKDVLNTAAPIAGSPASPVRPGYQPLAWQLPPEPSAESGTADRPGAWLGRQEPVSRAADPQAGAVVVSGSGNCPYCGAAYRSEARYCWSCGRSAV